MKASMIYTGYFILLRNGVTMIVHVAQIDKKGH